MIALEKIQEIYDHMHSSGVNTDADMLYGYFFTNSEPQTLEKVSELLKSEGFEHVDIYPDDTGEYWLHLERIESHNATSLFELNKTLYAVADKFNLSSYDGFDIGNPDKNLPIERDTYAVPEQFASKDFIIDDLPCLLSANKAFEPFPHKNEFQYFIEIKSKYRVGSASQLPTEEELQDLNDFEIFVENNLTQNKIPNYYVGRTTYNSERTVYLVTNEKEGATGLMDFLKEHGNQRDFEFSIIEDPEWKIYSELMNRLE